MPNPGKYFQKSGGHSEGFLEKFSRLFSKFLISGHEWGAFLENFSSRISWVPTQEKSLFSDFGSWVRSFSGKFFQLHFMSAFSGKKFVLIISFSSGIICQRFFLPKLKIKSEKFQKHNKNLVWKNFPEILLSHDPKIVNFNFYLKSCTLENFSKNSPESWPKILKMAFGNIFQKTSWVTTRIFRCDQFWTQIIKIGNLRGLLWYHA